MPGPAELQSPCPGPQNSRAARPDPSRQSPRFIWYTIFQHVWPLPATAGPPPATWGAVHVTHPGLRAERSPAGFRRLLLASPQRHNPIDTDLAHALRDAFAANPAELVVLGSAEPAMFCAGADMTIGEAERAQVSALLYECLEIMITRPGPVIAAVGGPAVAGGAQLAAAADLRIAGPAARFRWIGRRAAISRWAPGCCPTWWAVGALRNWP